MARCLPLIVKVKRSPDVSENIDGLKLGKFKKFMKKEFTLKMNLSVDNGKIAWLKKKAEGQL